MIADRTPLSRVPRAIVLLGAVLLLAAGCDTSVDPFVPHDVYHYSIFGVLDAAADTQFIRVEAVADSMQVGAPPEIDVTVTLEHLGTERTIALRDSFMEVHSGVFVHNFWTAAPVEPGATYRLRVERSDGAVSEATATLPGAPPEISTERIFLPCCTSINFFSVGVQNADRLAALQVLYPIQDIVHTVSYFDAASEQGGGFATRVDYERDLEPFKDPFAICPSSLDRPYAWITAAAATPEYPDLRGVDLDAFARPDSFSNVENGHGFFGGVYSDTVRVAVERASC